MFDRDRCILSFVDFLDGFTDEGLKLYTQDGKEIHIPVQIPESEKNAEIIPFPSRKTS